MKKYLELINGIAERLTQGTTHSTVSIIDLERIEYILDAAEHKIKKC